MTVTFPHSFLKQSTKTVKIMQEKDEKSGYKLSRDWFDFCFANPEKVRPTHTALYFFAVEHCNRLGWKEKFGLPTTMAKEAIGIHSYNTYIKTLNDLIQFGFIKLVQKSKNQYSSNIIALSNFNKAHDKALDKALIKHVTKQGESTVQSIDSIIKHITSKPYNQLTPQQKEKISVWVSEVNDNKYDDFIKQFNLATGKKIRVLDGKTKGQLKARLKEGFTIKEILSAAKNCSKDEYHKQNPQYLTPEFITRSDKLQKYLNTSTNNAPDGYWYVDSGDLRGMYINEKGGIWSEQAGYISKGRE